MGFKRFGESARLVMASLLTLGSALTIGLSSFGSAAAETFNDGGVGCSIQVLAPKNAAFSISGNMATVRVQVNGPASCRETVSLSSWNAPFGSTNFRPFQDQRFFTGKTVAGLAPGMHDLSVAVNRTCDFQVDILLGSKVETNAGNANFGPNLMGFSEVNAGVCRAPQATPAPTPAPTPKPTTMAPTPTAPTPAPAPAAAAAPAVTNTCSGNTTNSTSTPASQGGNCSTNTTVVQTQTPTPPVAPTQQVTTSGSAPMTAATTSATQSVSAAPATESAVTTSAAPAATPASLVNTGPATVGGMIGLFAGVTMLGTLAHGWFMRRKLA